MKPIEGKSRSQAWVAAARALFDAKDRIHNLIIEIENPAVSNAADVAVERRVDEFLRAREYHPVNTVAETIFPGAEYKQRGIAGVYDYPKSIYPLIKSESPWGTYALRLTQRAVPGKTEPIVPLQLLIDKAKRQAKSRSPKHAVYELEMETEALELPLYETHLDHKRIMGGQCLSHISVKLGPKPDYALYLTAIYRYQWFTQKAFGNFLGLARLQACIAREVGVPIGPLVCHATLSVLEDKSLDSKTPWTRAEVEKLICECEALLAGPSEVVA